MVLQIAETSAEQIGLTGKNLNQLNQKADNVLTVIILNTNKMEAMIVKQDEKLWVELRNLAWKHDKKTFDKINKHTFKVKIEGEIIKIKGVARE